MSTEYDSKGKPLSENWEDYVTGVLQNKEDARTYLELCALDEDYDILLLAMRDVTRAADVFLRRKYENI